ncbi:MAG: hypothetical protein K0R88_1782 [Solirubrobacterales bacterium]|jgi:hypothetical protein|nr:hypothetical protein [Solirubrobacterales bacterium]
MGLLTLEAIGPKGEQLAIEAGRVTEIAVGYDGELECATFDSDSFDEAELEGVIFDALSGLDPDWRTHLRAAE